MERQPGSTSRVRARKPREVLNFSFAQLQLERCTFSPHVSLHPKASGEAKMRVVGLVCLVLLGALAWQARGQDEEEENTETFASALLEVR